jgi:hypothetical protein
MESKFVINVYMNDKSSISSYLKDKIDINTYYNFKPKNKLVWILSSNVSQPDNVTGIWTKKGLWENFIWYG